MKPKLSFFSLTAAALALIFGGASAAPLVRVAPDTTEASIGDQVSVEIFVNGEIDSLMGWNVTVRFDPECLSLNGVVEGSLPDESGHATFFAWLNPGCACDSLCINGSVLGATIDGPGALIRIDFTATQVGAANIEIARSDLRDGTNDRIAHDNENGIIIVTAPTGTVPPGAGAGELMNWPNPFNPTTEIILRVPDGGAGDTRLAIYSPSGMKVKDLFSGPLASGEHRFAWDGRDDDGRPAAAGVYLAVANAPRGPIVRKLVLAR